MKSLPTHLKSRNLVTVARRKIDDRSIQGFVVGRSSALLALEYVYDFQIDGLMVLRLADVSSVDRTETDKFQQKLLAREGIRPGEQVPRKIELDEWKAAIEQLSPHYPIMILERELGPAPEFAIGRPIKTGAAEVEFLTFSGIGRWAAKPEKWKYSQITSLQVNNRYANFYQRYFEQDSSTAKLLS
jgi:hypothetical protein